MRGRIHILSNRISFKPYKYSIFFAIIIPTIMFCAGIYVTIGLFPFFDEHTSFDILGFLFACLWTLLVFVGGSYNVFDYGKTVIVDSDGVTLSFLSYKKHFEWCEIQDYGISYYGHAQGGMLSNCNAYQLYFSTEEQVVKNKHKKKLKSNAIKIVIKGDDYYTITTKVIPFCQRQSSIVPFVAEDGFHII